MTPRSYFLTVCLIAPFALAVAQLPPVPPAPPVAPVSPLSPLAPLPPRAPSPPRPLMGQVDGWIDAEGIRHAVEAAREASMFDRESVRHLAETARAAARIDQDMLRSQVEAAREATRALNIDTQHLAELARASARDARWDMPAMAPMPPMPAMNFDYNFNSTGRSAPVSTHRYQGDPADSAYQRAFALFNRQEYRSAADGMAGVRTRFPNSRYMCAAGYYESFARYRLNQGDDLATARRVLDGVVNRCTGTHDGRDIPQLRARIVTALATRGDRDAIEEVRRLAASGQKICDNDDIQVKTEALNAMMRMDPAEGLESLRTVLKLRDECTKDFRRSAIYMLPRDNNPLVVSLLIDIAKNDPEKELQYAAVERLGGLTSDAAYAAMEDFLRNSTDERMQRNAVSAMARTDNPRAQQAVRGLIDRKDVAESIRISAINSLGERERARVSGDYFRTLYTRVESDDLRVAVVNALGKGLTEENQQFLLNVAKNRDQAGSVRSAALSRISNSLSPAELMSIYQTADSRSMRQAIIRAWASRKDMESVDRMIDVLKTGTDPEIKRSIINYFSQTPFSTIPKVKQALADILKGIS